jgi:hypothetical protein
MKHLLNVAGGLLVVLAAVSAQQARGAVPFTYNINTTGDYLVSSYIQFGYTDTSTDAYDDGIDWPAPPANLDGHTIYFVGNTIPRMAKDFKALKDSETWELKVVLEGDATTEMSWELDSGSLDGNILQLIDKDTGALLVENMATTTSRTVTKTTTFTLSYGAANKPPVARDDLKYMMQRDGSVDIDVLANDYDPDDNPISIAGFDQPAAGGTVTQVDVGGQPMLRYTLPAPLPAEWTGTVAFDYQISDTGGRATSSATVTVEVADHVLVLPVEPEVSGNPGDEISLSYSIQREDTVSAITILLDMPHVPDPDNPGDVIYWSYVADSVALDETRAAATAAQVDGELTISFDALPADNSILSFNILIPALAQNDVDDFGGITNYSVGGIEQPEQNVPDTMLVVRRGNFDVDGNGQVTVNDLIYIFRWSILGFTKGKLEQLIPAGLTPPTTAEEIAFNIDNLGDGADVDANLQVTVNDLIYVFRWAILGFTKGKVEQLIPAGLTPPISAQEIANNIDPYLP